MNRNFDIDQQVRPHFRLLSPYSSARTEHSERKAILLDANENPFENEGLNRYPDPLQSALKEQIELITGVSTENIFIGNGSDEPIDLLIRLFCEPGKDSIIMTDPSYGMYKVSAAINNVGVVKIPLETDFRLNPQLILEKQNNNTRILFLCSPNNPTGKTIPEKDMLYLLNQFKGLVVIDEAYIDFSSQASMSRYLNHYSNLVVLQTLSKSRGLAGLRIGMALSSTSLIHYLNKIKPPYNISGPAQQIALHQLQKLKKEGKQQIQVLIEERQKLSRELEAMSIVEKVFSSEANFILVRFKNAKLIYESLKKANILVRDRTHELHCEDCLRISIGTAPENKELLKTLRSHT